MNKLLLSLCLALACLAAQAQDFKLSSNDIQDGNAAAQPKDLVIAKGANHVDLYGQRDNIPFDKITDLLRTNLK